MAYKQPLTTSTWTPSLTFGGGSTGMTYSTQTGIYTRVGNIIFYQFTIVLSAKGSSTGNALIANLPFSSNSAWEGTLRSTNLTFSGTSVTPQTNGATLQFVPVITASSIPVLTDTAFANNTTLIASGVYQVAGIST